MVFRSVEQELMQIMARYCTSPLIAYKDALKYYQEHQHYLTEDEKGTLSALGDADEMHGDELYQYKVQHGLLSRPDLIRPEVELLCNEALPEEVMRYPPARNADNPWHVFDFGW